MDYVRISTIAIIAPTLVVEPGIPVAGARLDYLDAVDHQLVKHVVRESGRRFPAVHHAGEAVLAVATPARAAAGLDGAGVSLLVARLPDGKI